MGQCSERVDGDRCGLAPNHEGLCVPAHGLKQCQAHWYPAVGSVMVRCEIKSLTGAVHDGDHRLDDFRWTNNVAIYPGTPEFRRAVDDVVATALEDLAGGADRTQVGGDHYTGMGIQPWAVIEDLGLDFFQGNALKYLMRAGRKGPALEDLKKARHYIEKCIERAERAGG